MPQRGMRLQRLRRGCLIQGSLAIQIEDRSSFGFRSAGKNDARMAYRNESPVCQVVGG